MGVPYCSCDVDGEGWCETHCQPYEHCHDTTRFPGRFGGPYSNVERHCAPCEVGLA